jgi:aryl-alcohol dehydrogenase-like predicted oxidoreductase
MPTIAGHPWHTLLPHFLDERLRARHNGGVPNAPATKVAGRIPEPPAVILMEFRCLGNTDLRVSTVALGAWPIAGLTSPDTNDSDSLATIRACFDLGINHIDTAFCYGRRGESERLIAQALGPRRREIVVATKGGIHWNAAGEQALDASPATLRRECHQSLRRLNTECVDLLYLHAPDPKVPVGESAGALRRLLDEGKTRAVGASNLNLAQLAEFARECPIAAFQPPYNMLQREIEADTLPWCRQRGIAVMVYWPLLKGLLAGKLRRDQSFQRDSRRKYPMFQGDEYQKNLDLVDRLGAIAASAGRTVAELVIAWTIRRPGVTSALCGAKRPEQLRETAGAMRWEWTEEQVAAIDAALAARGIPAVRNPV